jgi:hypothetical protein
MGWLLSRLPTALVWLSNELPPVGFRRGVAQKRRERRTLKSDMPTRSFPKRPRRSYGSDDRC